VLVLNHPDVESALLQWARAWCDLLATGQLEGACAQLDEPNDCGEFWTPVALAERLADAYGPGTVFRRYHSEEPHFTSAATATGREYWNYGAYDDGTGYWLNYGVPVNGEHSDLMAQFQLDWQTPLTLSVRLYRLDVM
jgi:hypothetical protein